MRWRAGTVLLLVMVVVGCGKEADRAPVVDTAAADYGSYYGTEEITFLDAASSNASLDAGLTSLSFVSSSGEEQLIRDLAPGRTLVLVVTRGNTVPICPYCSTQTAQLISSYEEFTKRGAEVAVVYPIETGDDSAQLDGFLLDVKGRLDDPDNPVPFPVLLDVELKGIDQLGIRKDLSKPATYIVDPKGHVQYAYVGEHIADRPSVSALLGEVDKLKPAAEPTDDAELTPASTEGTGQSPASEPATGDTPASDAVPSEGSSSA